MAEEILPEAGMRSRAGISWRGIGGSVHMTMQGGSESMRPAICIIALLFCCACSGARCAGGSAVSVAQCNAESDFSAHGKVVMKSVRIFKDGATSVIDAGRRDEYATRLKSRLSGREYYEICFPRSPPALGGGGCYFIEKESLDVLAKHLSV